MWIILESYFLITLLLTLLQSNSKACSQLGKRISPKTKLKPTKFIQSSPPPPSSSSLELEGMITTTCKSSGDFALTFDDGPFIFQSNISNYLSDRGVNGTFFINGYNWACIYDENIVEQLKHKILGVTPKFFRPPYGEINQNNLNILKKRGYQIINWSMESGDANGISTLESNKRYDQISKKFPIPQIALNHETYNTTAFEIIPHAIKVLQKSGYRLVSISDCLGLESSLHDFYGSVGKPQKRDSSWTCQGTPASSPN
ncbi:hypothetical protein CROQUDRAFT_716147 [Cronartium quercuum f. sp. fusiforme G11]|uniref:NodB homology domain-containing protein n=1 Tax=Cronartium quercuum f. sp. fusiforme G11 TaxID=708437 RepID=A0A9P6NJL9_9BASI|nr:hypothetical protein CROQUDRAFT_716147 [Cronartium quercuum f. sp. fusiforme G11]